MGWGSQKLPWNGESDPWTSLLVKMPIERRCFRKNYLTTTGITSIIVYVYHLLRSILSSLIHTEFRKIGTHLNGSLNNFSGKNWETTPDILVQNFCGKMKFKFYVSESSVGSFIF